MYILYPCDPFNTSAVSEMYAEEREAAHRLGLGSSLFSFEDFEGGVFRARPSFTVGERVLYRGWMLSVDGYARLYGAIAAAGGVPWTSPVQYGNCHYLPEWYPLCVDVTPETIIVPSNADFVDALAGTHWEGYFVKDYVKSLTTSHGSVASTPEEVAGIVSRIESYRGAIEGGICIRRFETLRVETEERYFVLNGRAYASEGEAPALVHEIAGRIDNPFFSIDLITSQSGELRLVELGDGQVSDRKQWSPARFAAMLHDGRE
jgi:hypothetical protein